MRCIKLLPVKRSRPSYSKPSKTHAKYIHQKHGWWLATVGLYAAAHAVCCLIVRMAPQLSYTSSHEQARDQIEHLDSYKTTN